MQYKEIKVTIAPYSEDISDLIISQLGEIGFESFSPTDKGFNGYIKEEELSIEGIEGMNIFDMLKNNFRIEWSIHDVENKNWNKVWEDSFSHILIDDKILIRTGFHKPVDNIEYDIIIEPKMSFGTGHHPTTRLMLAYIYELKETLRGGSVLDMGCGTSILSIMASKVGAEKVRGVDIDDWAYNNAMENISLNGINNIRIDVGDAKLLCKSEECYDTILANINRNILLEDMVHYCEVLNCNGCLVISGFYNCDLDILINCAESLGLKYISKKCDDEWCSALFYKNSSIC